VAGRDQRPVQGAEVKVHLGATASPSGHTDRHGEARLAVTAPRILVSVRNGQDTALVDTDFYSTLAIAPDVFIYSDRPIYKPGDKVRFRGILRQPSSFLARLFQPKKRRITVRLMNAAGFDVHTETWADAFGSFHGEFDVPQELETGVLR